jgi:hypothetical protein
MLRSWIFLNFQFLFCSSYHLDSAYSILVVVVLLPKNRSSGHGLWAFEPQALEPAAAFWARPRPACDFGLSRAHHVELEKNGRLLEYYYYW